MANIHYSIHGRGRGHVTRALPIIEALEQRGHNLSVFAGEDAYPILSEIRACTAVQSLMPNQGIGMFSLLFKRIRQAVREIRDHSSQIVIADGDLPPILAAHRLRIPSITVGHAEIFPRCFPPQGIPRIPWYREAFRTWVSAPFVSRAVAVNFIDLQPRSARTVVAAPSASHLNHERSRAPRDLVCYFRDQNGDAILRSLVDQGQNPLLFGRSDPQIAGTEFHPLDREVFLRALQSARAVVASAGSQLISECVALGIPIFALYKSEEDEQRLNVSMLRSAGLGQGCSFSEFSDRAMRDFLDALDTYQGHDGKNRPAQDVATAVCLQVRELIDGHAEESN